MQRFLRYTFVGLLVALLCFGGFANAQTFYGTTDIKVFKEGRDKELRNKDESPLKEEDFPKYKGLNYFPADKKYRVRARFRKTNDETILRIPTSSGQSQKYVKYGVVKFKINKKRYVLNVYRNDRVTREKYPEYEDLLFIPFKDLSNGKDSYGGGRYLYILDTNKKKIILDFNLTSNPSCAYGSDRYSCPIPPRANHLKVEIKAGEKSYPYSRTKK